MSIGESPLPAEFAVDREGTFIYSVDFSEAVQYYNTQQYDITMRAI